MSPRARGVELRTPFAPPPREGTIGVMLGSFDPPHRAHEHVLEELLRRFGHAIALVPTRHFWKRIEPGRNATLEQRLAMLEPICRRAGGRLVAGLAHEVLYLRLATALRQALPGCDIVFGLGDETFGKVLESRRYFALSGLAWTPADEQALAHFTETAIIFARGGRQPGCLRLPAELRGVSSTRIRDAVASGESTVELVSPEVADVIVRLRLYRGTARDVQLGGRPR